MHKIRAMRPAAAARTDTPSRLSFVATATFDCEAKAADGTPRRPTFAIRGYTGAAMSVGSFFSPVIVDLAGLKASSQQMPALLSHDPGQIVGQTDSVKIDADGANFTGVVTGDNAHAQEVVSQAKNGFTWQASIGANIDRREFLDAGKTAKVNGREVTGPMVIAREATIFEISFVPIGADSQTSASVAASQSLEPSKGGTMVFNEWVQAKGFDPAALSDAQRTFFQSTFDAEQAPQGQDKAGAAATASAAGLTFIATKNLDQIFADQRAEQARVDRITQLAATIIHERPGLINDVEHMSKVAIESKSTVAEFELAVMRLRAYAPATRTGSGPGTRTEQRPVGTVIEAALALTGKLEKPEKYFDEPTLEAAQRRYKHGIGLKDLLIMAAQENGVTGLSNADVKGMLTGAFQPQIRAEFSTLDLPGIMSNVANKFLLAGFNNVESSWREIAAITSVRDFKTKTNYSLTGGFTYDKVGPAGELTHATVGELSYTTRAETYGKMFAVTRTDIINDDLGALTQVPMKLGRGAALKLNLVFWTEFLADLNTFYTSGRGNVSTGAGSALSSAGLAAAQTKFRKQTDADNNPLGTMPRILLVPPELEITANELMTSLIVNTGGSATETKVPSGNVWANKFRTVVSSYLSNSTITGFSTAAWWLIADPNDLPLIEVAFLNGRETPVVESADADFNTLGIQMRGYHDWGVSKQEYRSAVRSAGS